MIDPEDRKRYVEGVRAGLKESGHLILATFAKDGPDRCSNLPVCQYDAALVRQEFGDGFEWMGESSEVHKTPWGKDQKFAYFVMKKLN